MRRLLFLAALAAVSCSDEKAGVDATNIIGTWHMAGKKVNGTYAAYNEDCSSANDLYVFGADGTYGTTLYGSDCEPFVSESGHWSRQGKTIQVLDLDPAAYLDGTFTVDNYNANELWLREEIPAADGTSTIIFYYLERAN
ncbi:MULTISPECIES: lipocalin family protein [unclassified Flavobacterium]|uniref:lipocalin family protein n=1 Tax=unclassified Flavobacterium TaxID=196869 RepID=UPI001F140A33|nr:MULTISPECIES: lipocalin family protein [unclassified Flavobacterium]UMY65893.1 lipocalin family protein [Flavobacterium sp. HJ-32-4]